MAEKHYSGWSVDWLVGGLMEKSGLIPTQSSLVKVEAELGNNRLDYFILSYHSFNM